MFVLKILTTVGVAVFMLIIGWFLLNTSTKDRATLVGFSAMEAVYLLSLICIWG